MARRTSDGTGDPLAGGIAGRDALAVGPSWDALAVDAAPDPLRAGSATWDALSAPAARDPLAAAPAAGPDPLSGYANAAFAGPGYADTAPARPGHADAAGPGYADVALAGPGHAGAGPAGGPLRRRDAGSRPGRGRASTSGPVRPDRGPGAPGPVAPGPVAPGPVPPRPVPPGGAGGRAGGTAGGSRRAAGAGGRPEWAAPRPAPTPARPRPAAAARGSSWEELTRRGQAPPPAGPRYAGPRPPGGTGGTVPWTASGSARNPLEGFFDRIDPGTGRPLLNGRPATNSEIARAIGQALLRGFRNQR